MDVPGWFEYMDEAGEDLESELKNLNKEKEEADLEKDKIRVILTNKYGVEFPALHLKPSS